MLEEEFMADASSLGALASRFVETESVPWIENAPGHKSKVIYYDPATEMLTILSKLDPGARIPPHTHEDLEQTFVLEGSLVDAEGDCNTRFPTRPVRDVVCFRPHLPRNAGRIIMLDLSSTSAIAVALAAALTMTVGSIAAADEAKYPNWKGQWIPVNAPGG